MKLGKTLYVKDRKTWRKWLAKNHNKTKEIWLIFYKKSSGKPRIPYNDAVEEALCYGWIDSTVKTVNEDKFAQRFSPRRKTSVLSEMNKERIRRLVAQGKMTRTGLSAVSHAYVPARSREIKMQPRVLAALKGDPEVWKNFSKFPESYKRIRIGWIQMTSRPEVFKQRLAYFIKMTKRNKRFGMVQ